MKCPVCGIENSGKYCINCGKLLLCPNCGSNRIGKFCGGCGKPLFQEEAILLPEKKSTPSNLKRITNKILPLILIFLIVGIIAYYYTSKSDASNSRVASNNTPTAAPEASPTPDDPAKKTFQSALAQIQSCNFEEALIELRSIPPGSAYSSDAEAKIDDILIPLANNRLDEAKSLYAEKKYVQANEKLQQAYGTTTPPLKEAADLVPLYEKMSSRQTNQENQAQQNIKITVTANNDSDKWTKAPEDTTKKDWQLMTPGQKADAVEGVIKTWESTGKVVLKDKDWFVKGLDTLYNEGKDMTLTKAMNVVALGGMAF